MIKRTFTKIRLLAVAAFMSCFVAHAQTAETPVQKYGMLKIVNGKVCDKNGTPVVLRGMSLFWSGYGEGAPFYDARTVKWLRDDWCVNVVRAALSVNTNSGPNYINNPAGEYAKIKTVIDACIANGIYVIVDFHSHEAENQLTHATNFFNKVATDYANVPNILYETYNEPIGQSWSTVKNYHNAIIPVIRAKTPNIIICGTPWYSQDVDFPQGEEVTGTNIAYTLHYYAGSDDHRQRLRDKINTALGRGRAIFVTEYGTTHSSGNGSFNETESKIWWDFLDQKGISSVNWSISNKNETSAALAPGVQQVSGWSPDNQLSTSGKLVRTYIKSKCNSVYTTGTLVVSLAGGKTQYNKGDMVTINAAATVTNGTISKVEFYSDGALIGTSTAAPYTSSIATLAAGGHAITAKSFDATGILIVESAPVVISVVGASNISTTGVTDQFENPTQYTELTGGLNGASCAAAAAKTPAAAGVYWYEDRVATTPWKAELTRKGDGKLRYLVSKPNSGYDVIGFNFGEYCEAGAKKKIALDLSRNAVLKITVNFPDTVSNTQSLDLKFQLKDEDGTVLGFHKNVVPELSKVGNQNQWWKHELGFSKNHPSTTTTKYDYPALAKGKTYSYEFDFKDAVTIKNPTDPKFPADINTTNADFDFSKVVELVMAPNNAKDDGDPTYVPLPYENHVIYFSGLQLGDHTLGPDICTTPAAPTASGASYCQNAPTAALTATGMAGLTFKWYTASTGGTASATAPALSTTTPGTTTYYVSQALSDTSKCESARTAVAVSVTAAPTANAGTEQTSATGPVVTLNGTGSATGTWTFVTGPIGFDGAAVTFTPSAASAQVMAGGLTQEGTYTFRYTVAGTAPCSSATSTVTVNITGVTGINNDAFLNENVAIYPNPVASELNVNLNNVSGIRSVKLVDMVGKVVFESASGSSVNIDMTNLNKGMYVVQIQSETGKLSKPVIKQ